MKTSRTPKIVIGVGLLAVYAAVLSTFILRDARPVAVAAAEPPATEAYNASDLLASAQVAPTPAEPVPVAGAQPAPVASTSTSTSITDEPPPVTPQVEAPADSSEQIAVAGDEEDGSALMVGN